MQYTYSYVKERSYYLLKNLTIIETQTKNKLEMPLQIIEMQDFWEILFVSRR